MELVGGRASAAHSFEPGTSGSLMMKVKRGFGDSPSKTDSLGSHCTSATTLATTFGVQFTLQVLMHDDDPAEVGVAGTRRQYGALPGPTIITHLITQPPAATLQDKNGKSLQLHAHAQCTFPIKTIFTLTN